MEERPKCPVGLFHPWISVILSSSYLDLSLSPPALDLEKESRMQRERARSKNGRVARNMIKYAPCRVGSVK